MIKPRLTATLAVLGATAAAGVAAGPALAAARSQLAAGYQARSRTAHQSFRYVAASWTVPSLSCPGPIASGGADGDSYFYVALSSGRFGSGQGAVPGSEQVGVRELCLGTEAAYATYAVMNGAYEVQGVAHPGDVISASVSYGAGKYHFTLHDDGHPSFSLSATCGSEPFGGLSSTCGRSAAEVGIGTGIPDLTLAEYGTATFSHVSITDATGHRGSFATNRRWNVSKYNEYNGSTLLATAGAVSARGTQFTDRWRNF